METDQIKMFIIESGPMLAMVKAHIDAIHRARDMKFRVLEQLGFPPETTEVWSSKYDGSMSAITIPSGSKLPKNFVAANWTKPDRQGRRHPKQGTVEHKMFFNEDVCWTPQELLIGKAYKVPTQINYKTASGSGSTAIGRMMNLCGFLWLSKEGPYALWLPDIDAIVKEFRAYHKKDKGFKITNDIASWKMVTEGLRPILEEEWDLMVAQKNLDDAKAKQAKQEEAVPA